eukprot:evm.model.scf_1357.2 EVM.evm.TU.scf_1357.2   scf_1357:20385-20708(+)
MVVQRCVLLRKARQNGKFWTGQLRSHLSGSQGVILLAGGNFVDVKTLRKAVPCRRRSCGGGKCFAPLFQVWRRDCSRLGLFGKAPRVAALLSGPLDVGAAVWLNHLL